MLHHRLSYPQFVYPLSPFVKPFQACSHWKQVSSLYCVTHKMLSQYTLRMAFISVQSQHLAVDQYHRTRFVCRA